MTCSESTATNEGVGFDCKMTTHINLLNSLFQIPNEISPSSSATYIGEA
jgi:hypothetical protein